MVCSVHMDMVVFTALDDYTMIISKLTRPLLHPSNWSCLLPWTPWTICVGGDSGVISDGIPSNYKIFYRLKIV